MPPATRAHKSTRSVSNNNNVEQVTSDLANLKIRSRTAAKAPEPSAAEKLRSAMLVVNEVSQLLGSAVKSGWKHGAEASADSEWSLAKITKAMEPVGGALSTLRAIYKEQESKGKLVDVERAALGVVSKLNGLRIYTLALDLLSEIQASILSLLGAAESEEPRPKSRTAAKPGRKPAASKQTPTHHLHLLRLPELPEPLSEADPVSKSLAVALATYQAHSVKAALAGLGPAQLEDLHSILTSPDFSLTRAPPLPTALPTEQLSALYVGIFQAIASTPALSPAPSTSAPPVARTASTRATSTTRESSKTSRATAKAAPASPSPSPEDLVLLCRKQALLILAQSPSLEKDINLFWDQATKWGAVYVKAASASSTPHSEQQIAQTLSTFFSDLIAHVPPESVQGARFEALCEWWMRFAKKVKDTETVQKITLLLQTPSTPKRPTKDVTAAPPPVKKSVSATDRQTPAPSRSSLLAILDRAALSSTPEDVSAATDALKILVGDSVADWSSGDLRRFAIAMADLRKSCAACWKAGGKENEEISRKAVGAIARCAEVPGFPIEVTISAIDALLTLSRVELDAQNYETYERANALLDQALKLADTAAPEPEPDDESQATLLRAISNTAYTLAGVLYNANVATSAISFAQKACEVGERALALGGPESKDKEIVALRDHMLRRWELLAVCQLKATDRRGAVDAYSKALMWSVVMLGPVKALDEKTSTLIGQLVGISVGELFEPESVALSRLFSNLEVEDGVLDLVMEKVVQVLEGMMHKPIARRAMEIAVEETMRLCGDQHPVKKARLMIGMLKSEYHSNNPPSSRISSDEILALLSPDQLKQDADLKPTVPQYIVQTHIWTALLLHKSNAPTAEIAEHAKVASEELLGLLAPPEAPVSVKSAGKRPVGRPRAGSRRTAKVGAKLEDKTAITKPALVFDDPMGLIQPIDMLAQVLGLLGHTVLKLQLLHLIVWTCEEVGVSQMAEAHIKTSVDLSTLYMQLGQMEMSASVLGRANELSELNDAKVDTPALVMLRLLYADVLARSRQTEQSVKTYLQAVEIADQIEDVEKNAAYMVKTQARLQNLQRSATACGVYASIQASRDDTVSMLMGLTQALRLWNRAVDILIRLTEKAQPVAPAEPANPFEVQDAKPTTLDEMSQAKKTVSRGAIMDGIQWQIAQGLLRTIFDLGEVYSLRGSVREAEFFLGQAQSLSESLQAPFGIGRSLIRQAEIKMARGLLDEALEVLAKAEDLVSDPVRIDTATLHCFLGHHRQREASGEDAYAMYTQAQNVLDEIDHSLKNIRRREPTSQPTVEVLAPDIRGLIMREKSKYTRISISFHFNCSSLVWLGRIGEVESDDQIPLDELQKLPRTTKSKLEEASLLGRIALHEVYSQFRSDLFLSSLTESAIAVPMGMPSKDATLSQANSSKEALNSLGAAEENFWKTLQLSVSRGDATRTREAATNLARIMAFQSSLGKQGTEGAVLAATLLDYSNATTLRQEMLDAIANKDKTTISADDLIWPGINDDGSPCPRPTKKPRGLFAAEESAEVVDLESGGVEMRQYWEFLKEKYSNSSFDTTLAKQINTLPKHWTVVTINVTDDRTALIVSRQRPCHPPVIFCLPLDRRSREGDDEEQFSYDDALDELSSIIETSDRITHEGVNIEGNKPAIAEWWSERTSLDQRMHDLLENIEFCWLGVFKSALAAPLVHGPDTLSLLRSRLDKAFKRNGIGGEKASARPKLDKGLLDCFSSISPKCRDEELEDLAYFILDLYQLHGSSVPLSEVDIDTLVVDLRTALEEHTAKTTPRSVPVDDHHIFLVLDKNAQRIPWESIPILRGRSVSRIPSISFLVDRIQLARHRKGLTLDLTDSNESPHVDRATIDPTRVRYVLNPKGDLKHTEKQFSPWLKRMTKEMGWAGIIGRKPTEEEMARSLSSSDLFIYFGHGGGEQFIRSQKVRHLPQCSAAMLWGCSSGAMRDMGDFDPIGTPYHYMLAGCPTLVATLWDVTDRECDRFAQSVFTSLGLDGPKKKAEGKASTSVVQAVALAREVCKLKYLTGAAPVVYGIPFYL